MIVNVLDNKTVLKLCDKRQKLMVAKKVKKANFEKFFKNRPAMLRQFFLSFLLFIFATCSLFSQKIELKVVMPLLEFPVDIASTGLDDRLFVVGENGKIQIVHPDSTVSIFLDLSSQITFNYAEQGLLGMAFDPDFAQNGWFYVFFTDLDQSSTVARFQVSSDPNLADPSSKLVILNIPQLSPKHKGGCLKFGPTDGYLYLSTGDSSLGGDPGDNSQNDLNFLGKILRLDVKNATATMPYQIPPTNPFAIFSSKRPEIWASGLRNPWRFSFDRQTGDLWLGDVGQDQREEVNFQENGSPGGLNFGWKCWEGDFNFGGPTCGGFEDFEPPILQYQNPGGGGCGASVTGGFVYRGTEFPDLAGWYIYSDACQGWFRGIKKPEKGGVIETKTFLETGKVFNFSAFGENKTGELYCVGYADHNLYRITDWCVSNPAIAPKIEQNGANLLVSGAASYQWLIDGQPIFGATDSVFVADSTGLFSVKIRDVNGCPAVSDAVFVEILAENEAKSGANFSVLPNPTTGFVRLEMGDFPEKISTIRLTDNLGQVVFFQKMDGEIFPKYELDCSKMAAGIYLLTVETESGKIISKKLTFLATH